MVVAKAAEPALRVAPEVLIPNPWNPNSMDDFMFRKTVASLDRLDFAAPVVVREKGDYYEIIDGEHRVKAAVELGMTQIPIWNLGDISDAQAKQLTVVLNETKGTADREKLGVLLRDLLSSESTAELLEVLPYAKADFQALLDVPDFDWDDIEKLTQERNPKNDRMRWVERIYRMPPEVAAVIDQAIGRVKAEEDGIEDWRALELICAEFLGK
jgi:ParB family chromosome partitioning protein